jgi:hypothetical protein
LLYISITYKFPSQDFLLTQCLHSLKAAECSLISSFDCLLSCLRDG